MEQALTVEAVEALMKTCIAEAEDGAEIVEGIVSTFALDPQALAENKPAIAALLRCLPDTFHEDHGGGWSFLNACTDKDERLWTGDQRVMEHLFVLGMGTGLVELQLPRELWKALPGGMPYFVVRAEAMAVPSCPD